MGHPDSWSELDVWATRPPAEGGEDFEAVFGVGAESVDAVEGD